MRTLGQIVEDTAPFPNNIIEQLPPRGDDYVKWTHYTQRVLLQHGAHRYEVTNVTAVPSSTKQFQSLDGDNRPELDASGAPLLVTRTRHVWAVSVRLFLSDDEWYDAVGEDDTPTAAESNAYKRACAHAGIGLHLYGSFWLHDRLQRTDDE